MNGKISCDVGKLLQVNSSDPSFSGNLLMIPYPEPGRWFLVLFPSCFLWNQSNLFPCRSANVTTVLFSILSTGCVMGACGDYGYCANYISNSIVYSTCVCDVGKIEETTHPFNTMLLKNSLLLVLCLILNPYFNLFYKF